MHGYIPPSKDFKRVESPTTSDYFSEANGRMREIVGEAHKLGFSNGYLHGCLYVHAGGGRMPPPHTSRHLRTLGLLAEDETLSIEGGRVLRFLHSTSTAKPYLWAQAMAKDEKAVARTLTQLQLVLP